MEIKDKLVEAIVKGIQEKKGQNITIADLRGIDGNIASYFVICQGNSPLTSGLACSQNQETVA